MLSHVLKYSLLFVVCSLSVFAQQSEEKKEKSFFNGEFLVKGEIIGYRNELRCPECGTVSGMAHLPEKLVMRLSEADSKRIGSGFILLHYAIYKRGILESEIQSPEIEILVRRKPDDWELSCVGVVEISSTEGVRLRNAQSTDYTFIKGFSNSDFAKFEALPCFISGTPPSSGKQNDH